MHYIRLFFLSLLYQTVNRLEYGKGYWYGNKRRKVIHMHLFYGWPLRIHGARPAEKSAERHIAGKRS